MNRIDCGMELKFAPDAEAMTFEGYGAVFGNVDAYGDVIKAGSFAAHLAEVKAGREPWPLMLSEHGMGLNSDAMTPVGVWTDIVEDGHGLRVQGKLAGTPRGMELYTLAKMEPRPALDGMSIGYVPKKWEPRSKPEDPKRTLTEISLIEISIVSRPANRLARVSGVKSVNTIREFETFLRDVGGFSVAEAKAIASRGYSALAAHRDGEADEDMSALVAALQRRGSALRA